MNPALSAQKFRVPRKKPDYRWQSGGVPPFQDFEGWGVVPALDSSSTCTFHHRVTRTAKGAIRRDDGPGDDG